MSFLRLILSITLISSIALERTTNGIISIDWTNSVSNCENIIRNHFNIVNIEGQTPTSIQTYVCKTNGTVLLIDQCASQSESTIEVLSYFFTLPENNADRQCECQAKCVGMPESSYTMKYLVGTKSYYFTTSNPCVAFCNKGYEIFLSSYAVNSYPNYDGTASIVKSFDSECYNRLNDTNKKIRQISLMKIELCKARIICNLLVNKYIEDLNSVEVAIYGSILANDYIMSSQEKYWTKPVTGSNTCLRLNDTGMNTFCINSYQLDTNFVCFIDIIDIGDSNHIVHGASYAGSMLRLNKCVDGTLDESDYEAKNTGECLCNYYEGQYMFSTDLLENIYSTLNDRYLKYGQINYYFSDASISLEYQKEEFSNGYCECKTLEDTYDYICGNKMYASCAIEGSKATSEIFTNDDDKVAFLNSMLINPVDMVLGYKEDECNNLNVICQSPKSYETQCILKKHNGFQYPIFKLGNDFVNCVNDYFVDQGNDSLNYYYNCPVNSDCNTYSCSVEMFSKCNSSYDDALIIDFCAKYDFECALTCLEDNEKVCVEENASTLHLLASKYDVCVRQCLGINISTLCETSDISNCEISDCNSMLVDECNKNGGIGCPETSICESSNLECICLTQTCSEKNSIIELYCYLSNNTETSSFKVTEKDKCIDICQNNSLETDYIICENCLNTQESCCDALCVDMDDANLTDCITVNQVLELISEKRKCINRCNGISFIELSLDQCNNIQCSHDCATIDNTLMNFCTYDEDVVKNCTSAQNLCNLNCTDNSYLNVDCSAKNDYNCFLSYCDNCINKKTLNSEIICPEQCICKDYNISSISQCICFSDTCRSKINSTDIYCSENSQNYEVITNLDICIKQCNSENVDNNFLCNNCQTSADCCKSRCTDLSTETCVKYNDTFFYSSLIDICEKQCDSITYQVTDTKNCCLKDCNPSADILCLMENSVYYNASRNVYCDKLCIEGISDIIIDNEYNCCFTDCLNQSSEPVCINSNGIYEYATREAYCDMKCNSNNSITSYSDSLCCENSCYLQQSQHQKGSYCDENLDIYKSWVDYCIYMQCKNISNDIIFCSSSLCTVNKCKEQIANKNCSNITGHPSISIKKNGKCTFYSNSCFANTLMKLSEQKYDCDQSEINDCTADPKLYLTYSSAINIQNSKAYCKNDQLISSSEYYFYTRCLNDSEFNIIECPGSNCDQNYCKRAYCKNKCASTERLYWGYDCNYYESTCEVDCLGIEYFDFFDIPKLINVCRDNSQLYPALIDLVTLKKNICLITGEVKVFNIFVNWIWKLYTDCFRLGSKNLADCKRKCTVWASKYK